MRSINCHEYNNLQMKIGIMTEQTFTSDTCSITYQKENDRFLLEDYNGMF